MGILGVIGILFVVGLVITHPLSKDLQTELEERRPTEGFEQVLYAWGDKQQEESDKMVDAAVAPVEGDLVGEHEIAGANWSIPNIIRHWLGVD